MDRSPGVARISAASTTSSCPYPIWTAHSPSTETVYTADPDGVEVEIIWRAPDDACSYDDVLTRRPLDVGSARERWGGHLATGPAPGAPA